MIIFWPAFSKETSPAAPTTMNENGAQASRLQSLRLWRTRRSRSHLHRRHHAATRHHQMNENSAGALRHTPPAQGPDRIEELVRGRYFNWCCESEQETDRDTQKYHKLLLRARKGEFSQQGYLTREDKRRRMMRVMVK